MKNEHLVILLIFILCFTLIVAILAGSITGAFSFANIFRGKESALSLELATLDCPLIQMKQPSEENLAFSTYESLKEGNCFKHKNKLFKIKKVWYVPNQESSSYITLINRKDGEEFKVFQNTIENFDNLRDLEVLSVWGSSGNFKAELKIHNKELKYAKDALLDDIPIGTLKFDSCEIIEGFIIGETGNLKCSEVEKKCHMVLYEIKNTFWHSLSVMDSTHDACEGMIEMETFQYEMRACDVPFQITETCNFHETTIPPYSGPFSIKVRPKQVLCC